MVVAECVVSVAIVYDLFMFVVVVSANKVRRGFVFDFWRASFN
jgi:hypothetical protein